MGKHLEQAQNGRMIDDQDTTSPSTIKRFFLNVLNGLALKVEVTIIIPIYVKTVKPGQTPLILVVG